MSALAAPEKAHQDDPDRSAAPVKPRLLPPIKTPKTKERKKPMAAVEITISGMLYDKLARTTQNVVLIGEASLTGLGVGGGPIIPPEQPPRPPHVEHPIPPIPAHPIVLPPEKPTEPPTEPPTQPPDSNWVWGWDRQNGWHPVYVPGDKPQPPPV